ncbi:olfactory receptor 10AG1-like, partial [Sigmodon hispidus]
SVTPSLPLEFILLGFSDTPKLHWFLFGIFLFIYIIILLGNGIIILITRVEPTLQTPMYFFISNFSFVEICYVSVTLPRMLMDLFTLKGTISFFACATQLCIFLIVGAAECFLLAVMAYDRYVAICHPLHYSVVMSHKVCTQLVVGCWVIGMPIQVGQTYQILSLPFCETNRINHFFCDILPLLKLACGNIFVNEIVVFLFTVLIVTVPFLLILASYVRIISTIFKLPSNTGRSKAFSTCSSHLIVVILFYGSGCITYLKPKSNKYEEADKLFSLFYTILTPVFNPLIYSLRNKDVTGALKKLFTRSLLRGFMRFMSDKMIEFILLGFSDIPSLQWMLFIMFLFMYLTILMCNSIIILLAKSDPTLQTPMYFFLSNFSFLEICYVTATIPRMLMDLYTLKGNISVLACATQMYFVLMLGGTECLLLAAMAYDRYVAICKPLQYALLMNDKVCLHLVAASWISGIPVEIGQTYQIFSLDFCASNRIDHFFCDIPPLLKLACGDTFVNTVAVYVVAVLFVMVPFLLIIVSYVKIICNIMKLSSAKGRAKAFSTCSSHLIVVVLFYGTASITYLQPKQNQSEGMGKLLSLFYTILIPALNPIIYTLRNKDIMMSLSKLKNKLSPWQFVQLN